MLNMHMCVYAYACMYTFTCICIPNHISISVCIHTFVLFCFLPGDYVVESPHINIQTQWNKTRTQNIIHSVGSYNLHRSRPQRWKQEPHCMHSRCTHLDQQGKNEITLQADQQLFTTACQGTLEVRWRPNGGNPVMKSFLSNAEDQFLDKKIDTPKTSWYTSPMMALCNSCGQCGLDRSLLALLEVAKRTYWGCFFFFNEAWDCRKVTLVPAWCYTNGFIWVVFVHFIYSFISK